MDLLQNKFNDIFTREIMRFIQITFEGKEK